MKPPERLTLSVIPALPLIAPGDDLGAIIVAAMEIAKICQALDTYYTIEDYYPTTDQGIAALVEKSDAFPDGLLNKLPRDPWKNPYVYQQPGRDAPYEVLSYGADNQEGGEGADKDITSTDVAGG